MDKCGFTKQVAACNAEEHESLVVLEDEWAAFQGCYVVALVSMRQRRLLHLAMDYPHKYYRAVLSEQIAAEDSKAFFGR